MVIEDSQAEEESASDAEFMPQQQQPQPPQKRQPEQQQRQRQRQQQERPAEGAAAAAAAAAAGRRRRPAAPPPPRARQQPPPRQQQQQQQQQQRLAAPEPGDPRQRLNRKLRAELHNLQESALQQEEALTDPKSGRLIGFMEQAAVLGKSAERPRENAVQTGVLATFAGLGSRMIASYRSTTAGKRPVDLLTALKRQFGQPGLLQQPQQQHGASALDWAGIGAAAAAAGMWRGAPGVSSMLGPLQQEAKVRKAAQRRQRAPVAAQVTPDENPLAKTAETQETDKWVETMLQVLSRCPPRVTLVALVVNHCSFSQTVENIFALSFLVKDMWCKLEKDPQRGLLVTCLTTEQRQAAMQQHEQKGGAAAAAAAAAGASGGAHQFMLNIDMALWHDMCRVVAPGDALMPHREPVVQEQQQQQQQ
ncbi:hypothetical protein OEZ86_010473 [Tetradesmus obliquus]|nr:hypothetical protein OEZ86_010473 [Tetradesmus obliquus]